MLSSLLDPAPALVDLVFIQCHWSDAEGAIWLVEENRCVVELLTLFDQTNCKIG